MGAAGALVSPIVPFQPAGGLGLSVASFNIVIIGGMGSLPGAFLGGLIVSVAESPGAVFLSPSMKELVSFTLLIVILLFVFAYSILIRFTLGICLAALNLCVQNSCLRCWLCTSSVSLIVFVLFFAFCVKVRIFERLSWGPVVVFASHICVTKSAKRLPTPASSLLLEFPK